MPDCQLCSRDYNRLGADRICEDCADEHALPPPCEPLRPRLPCARCNHTVLVRCKALRERGANIGNHASAYVAPLAATLALEKHTTFWAGRRVRRPSHRERHGLIEAYVCRKCGFTELYTRDPASIPIGPTYGTEEIDVGSDSPYR